MATNHSKAFAEQIHRNFITHANFDKAMDEIAERLDQHVLLESARIAQLERAIGSMYDSQYDTPYGQVKNWNGSENIPGESWLISPVIACLESTNSPMLSFITGFNYIGAQLEVLVSTNYTSGEPSTASWTALTTDLSPGGWEWTPSGALSLSSFQTNNTRIAFKYTGTDSDGKTWEVDDIKITVQ